MKKLCWAEAFPVVLINLSKKSKIGQDQIKQKLIAILIIWD